MEQPPGDDLKEQLYYFFHLAIDGSLVAVSYIAAHFNTIITNLISVASLVLLILRIIEFFKRSKRKKGFKK